MKELKDYLHLYLGCKVYGPATYDGEITLEGVCKDGFFLNSEYYEYDGATAKSLQLLLRRLSDMSEDDWKKCFELSRGIYDQSISDKMKRMSSTDVMFTLGKAQFIFGYHNCFDNDVRIGSGLCFYLKRYLIKDGFAISDAGLEANETQFQDMSIEQVLNVNHILNYLRKEGFDCDDLIESNLAIDKQSN